MPTYVNTASKKEYVIGQYVLPNESVETTIYINNPNLTLTSHSPYVKKSVLLCEDYSLTAGQSVIVNIPCPTSNNLYYLSVLFIDKPYKLYIDMDPSAIPLIIDNLTYYYELVNWDIHAYLKLVNTSDTDTAKARVVATSY